MTQGKPVTMPAHSPPRGTDLARLLGLRLCHDLSGAAGTVGNALELVGSSGGDAMTLAVDAATVLRRRLVLWRAMLGGQGEAPLATLLSMVDGMLAGGRVRVDAAALDPAALVPAPVVPVLLTALALGGEALPRGGVVRLAGDLVRDLVVLPDGPRAAWPPPLLTLLTGGEPPGAPTGRDVLPYWLQAAAASAGVGLGLALPSGDGVGPLVLTLPR